MFRLVAINPSKKKGVGEGKNVQGLGLWRFDPAARSRPNRRAHVLTGTVQCLESNASATIKTRASVLVCGCGFYGCFRPAATTSISALQRYVRS